MIKTGVDISVWNGSVNWDVLSKKADFVMIKASEGDLTDSAFAHNWANARAAKMSRGAYLFYRCGVSPVIQAQSFLTALGGDRGELPYVVDVEDTAANHRPWTEDMVNDLRQCLAILENNRGAKPLIYTANWYWHTNIVSGGWATAYGLWICDIVTPLTDGKPILTGQWEKAAMWQYSGDGNGRGADYGVQSRDIDLDILFEEVSGMEYDSPVGTAEDRAGITVWPTGWVDATGYAAWYTATGVGCYHTGADLNLNIPFWDADNGSPVYSVADGLVVYAERNSPWGVDNAIVVIKHAATWSRYAHVRNITVRAGDNIMRGQKIAMISNGGGRYPNHLHFDIAAIDLGTTPGDWPGADLDRLKKSYLDPLAYIIENHKPGKAQSEQGDYEVLGIGRVRVRAAPGTASSIIGAISTGKVVNVKAVSQGWARVDLAAGGSLVRMDTEIEIPLCGFMSVDCLRKKS